MPRAKSTSYATTRIELGVKERDMLETWMLANAIPKVAIGVAGLVGAIGIGMAGYGLYWTTKKMYGWGEEAAEQMQQWYDKAESVVVEGVVGKSKYTDPQTQETYTNPFAGVPVLGGLFGFGMKQGAKTDSEADAIEVAERRNPEGKTELGEGEPLRDYQKEAEIAGTFWRPTTQCWVSPITGQCVSYDRQDPRYANN